jgi:hypothetical protein
MNGTREPAHGLRFAQGPIALPDSDVRPEQIARGSLTRAFRRSHRHRRAVGWQPLGRSHGSARLDLNL